MPINYSKYCKGWKLISKFIRFYRAKNRCEVCGVENHKFIFRCIYNNKECYQDADGNLYDADNSKLIAKNTEYYDLEPLTIDRAIKVVLTVAHLDHNIENNSFFNLKALCQRCHLRYDAKTRKKKPVDKMQLEINLKQ